MNNFPRNDVIINIARGLFAANMFLTIPLECFVAREVVYHCLLSYEGPTEGSVDLTMNASLGKHLLTTSVLVLSAMIIALATCNLGFVLEITGGMSATALGKYYLFSPFDSFFFSFLS